MNLIVTPNGHGLGMLAGLPDAKDHPFMVPRGLPAKLPATFDKRSAVKTVWDQGQLGSCTGHGAMGALRMLLAKEKKPDFIGSRLGAYYFGRALENTVAVDAGAQIRDVIKQTTKIGVIPEALWPYNVRDFADTPNAAELTEAAKHLVTGYQAVPNDVTAVRAAIHTNWHVVIGIMVYDSFESDAVGKTGKVPVPKTASEQLLGGHCVYLVGWTKTAFVAVNSWSTSWGAKGFFTLPNEFITDPNLGSDFWTMVSA